MEFRRWLFSSDTESRRSSPAFCLWPRLRSCNNCASSPITAGSPSGVQPPGRNRSAGWSCWHSQSCRSAPGRMTLLQQTTVRARAVTSQALLGGLLLTLTGCVATVSVAPAPQAVEVACAGVVVRLPSRLAGLSRRVTDAQGTGAWGDPVTAVLRCGVPVGGPTTRPCFTFGRVDWVAQSRTGRRVVFETFGRSPQLQLSIDSTRVSAAVVLDELSSPVRTAIPATFMRCLGGSTETPTPMPRASSTRTPDPR